MFWCRFRFCVCVVYVVLGLGILRYLWCLGFWFLLSVVGDFFYGFGLLLFGDYMLMETWFGLVIFYIWLDVAGLVF